MSTLFKQHKEDQKCSVNKKYDGESCFSIDALCRMAAAWNIECNNTGEGTPITIKEHKGYLIKELTKALSNICDNQICWLNQEFIKSMNDAEINDHTFLPKIGQGRFSWLNTTNIVDSMKQYEIKHEDFKFLGCVPINFNVLPQYEIKNMDLDLLYVSGIRQLGFIFNLDEHWQSGSHWVSMYANLKKNQIYFFDSGGKRPVKRIRDLVNRISTWCYKRNIKKSRSIIKKSEEMIDLDFMESTKNPIEKSIKSIKYNSIVHQKKNSECGVYSINFIRRMLLGETFESITKNPTNDDEMNECRKIYFRFE